MGITSKADLSTDGGVNARRAAATARSLLEAYYLQDERERHLLSGDTRAAVDAATRAVDRMGVAYEVEFPHVDPLRARQAGEAFMCGLFVQDEIENWDRLRSVPDADLQDVLVCDSNGRYGADPVDDDRWETVEAYLRTACRKARIDERYAERQTRFWLYHGQLDGRWEGVAREAHELKLRTMVGDLPETTVRRLGERFVDGVRTHDEWTHSDETRDLAAASGIVTAYYEEVFELRSRGGQRP